ncbi:hypothetical protein [Streptomyces sp. NPDC093223]|uniref:hypothetical protein n=1 Tax=Streptomyces sp. NPDC093223 TaxID=3366033 RepID=UPI0037FD6883
MPADLGHLAPFAANLTNLLADHGHHPVAGRHDGYTLNTSWDGSALVLTYWCEPKDGHEQLVGAHIHRRGSALKECIEIIRNAGHQVTRHPTVQTPGRAPVESGIIFPAPEPEPEPEPVDPSLCPCDPAEICERAARLAVAAADLTRGVTAASARLLDALSEAAIEPVDHAPWGPEGAAALLDHTYGILASLAPLPDESAVRDLECRGCEAPACRAANGLARSALRKAAHLAAVRSVSLAATRTVLDRAYIALTPGDRWHSTLRSASDELNRTYFTAAAALRAPAGEIHGRYRRSARRRTGLPVNLRRGGVRRWFVQWGRAIWY